MITIYPHRTFAVAALLATLCLLSVVEGRATPSTATTAATAATATTAALPRLWPWNDRGFASAPGAHRQHGSSFSSAAAITAVADDASFHPQAITTCRNVFCAAEDGTCESTSTSSPQCPASSWQGYNSSFVCNCKPYAADLPPGTLCGSLPGGNVCGSPETRSGCRGTTEQRCYGQLGIGDTCASAYDCAYPRVCTDGVCQANIAAAAVCRPSLSDEPGVCPLTHWCPNQLNAVCTAYLLEGASCSVSSSTSQCEPGTYCVASTLTCTPFAVGVLADGAVPEYGAWECASQLVNSSSGACINWDANLALYNSVYASAVCDLSVPFYPPGPQVAQCGELAVCMCGRAASGNTASCKLQKLAPAVSRQEFELQMQVTALRKQGCEARFPGDLFLYVLKDDARFCSVTSGLMRRFVEFSCAQLGDVSQSDLFCGIDPYTDCAALIVTSGSTSGTRSGTASSGGSGTAGSTGSTLRSTGAATSSSASATRSPATSVHYLGSFASALAAIAFARAVATSFNSA